MAGLAKVLLELEHSEVYPQIHFAELNPRIRLEGTALRIPTRIEPWPMDLKPRFAGISSFGFGGTNAHIVIEEAREAIVPRSAVERPVHIATLSAKTQNALSALARVTSTTLANAIAGERPLPAADVAYTLNVGRGRHLHRAAVIGASLTELVERFAAVADAEPQRGVVLGRRAMPPPVVAFLFSGQGSQYAGMGRELYQSSPTFRMALDRCAALFDPLLDRPLLSLLFPPEGAPDLLAETRYTQPALFAIEYALTMLWQSWGVVPDVVVGHSVGEYVAVCVAGALSLEDAIRLIAARGRLMNSLPRDEGAMAAVLGPRERVEQTLVGETEVEIAAVNAPENITISGRRSAVERVTATLEAAGISVVPINVSHAFHSPLMEPILDEFAALVRSVELRPLQIALATNLDGQLLLPGAMLDARYWREHARHAVLFADGLRAVHAFGAQLYVEIGPNPTLIGMGRRTLQGSGLMWAASLKAGESEWRTLLAALAAVFGAGKDIAWDGFDADYRRLRLPLPTYPFERSRFWFDLPDTLAAHRGATTTVDHGHPVTRSVADSPYPTVQATLSPESPPYLAEHQVQGSVVVPGALYVELMLDAAAGAGGGADVAVPAIDDVEFARALFLPVGSSQTIQAIVSPNGTGGHGIQVYSRPVAGNDKWTLRATASLGGMVAMEADVGGLDEIEQAKARCTTTLDPAEFYSYMSRLGLGYRGAFKGIRELARRRGEAVALIEAPESIRANLGRYHIHPALLDAMAQVFAVAGPGHNIDDVRGLWLPVGLGRLRARRSLPARFWAHATLNADALASGQTIAGRLRAFDETGNLILQVDDWRVQVIDGESRSVAEEPVTDWLYQVEWQPAELAERAPKLVPVDIAAAVAGGPRSWLILDDEAGTGLGLAAALPGDWNTRLVTAGPEFSVTADGKYVLRPGSRQDIESLWRAVVASGEPLPDGVVSFWPLDAKRPESGDAPIDGVVAAALGFAHLVQGLAAAAGEWPLRLVIVTRGASSGFGGGDESSLLQAPVTGLARVVRMEYPQFEPIVIDLESEPQVERCTGTGRRNEKPSGGTGDRTARCSAAHSTPQARARCRGRRSRSVRFRPTVGDDPDPGGQLPSGVSATRHAGPAAPEAGLASCTWLGRSRGPGRSSRRQLPRRDEGPEHLPHAAGRRAMAW